MGVGRHVWALRVRLLGSERVVTGAVVDALGRSRMLGRRGRRRVRALHIRELLAGPPSHARIPAGDAVVELGGAFEGFPIDWKAFSEVFAEEPYAADYRGAHVLDIGAHKGYFGAYALAGGAARVVSFEPAATNFEVLQRTAATAGDRWSTCRAAVAGREGTGTLLLDRTSWAHSLQRVERPAGTETVQLVTLSAALSELPGGGARTIVKVDAEGAECEILARPEDLERVDMLFVEWHAETATCSVEELIRAVEAGGLARDPHHPDGALRFRRRRPDPEDGQEIATRT